MVAYVSILGLAITVRQELLEGQTFMGKNVCKKNGTPECALNPHTEKAVDASLAYMESYSHH